MAMQGIRNRKARYLNIKSDTFSICACHPCAGAMLIFSVSFQFYRMRRLLHRSKEQKPPSARIKMQNVLHAGIEPATFGS